MDKSKSFIAFAEELVDRAALLHTLNGFRLNRIKFFFQTELSRTNFQSSVQQASETSEKDAWYLTRISPEETINFDNVLIYSQLIV